MSQHQFVSYAQNQEDVVLARALHPDREQGFWIDVGAGDPVWESVTAAFSERGWRGINVEPVASEYEKLLVERPNDVNLCLAIGATAGTATLYEGPAHDPGASTMRSDIVASHGTDADTFTPVEVPVCTLAELVADYVDGPVDFLKIDVEGLEYDVIAGADFSRFHPRVLVVEATYPNTTKPSHESWEPLLLDAGYQFAMFDGLNRFYAREGEPDLLEALSIPANVLDNYVSYRWQSEFGQAKQFAEDLSEQLADLRLELAAVETERETAQRELLRTDSELARALGNIGKWETEAWSAHKTARYAQDEARIASERAAGLQDELGVAQLRSAHALAEMAAFEDRARDLDERVAALEHELRIAEGLNEQALTELTFARDWIVAMEATRTFRYTARLRNSYGRFRRALHLR